MFLCVVFKHVWCRPLFCGAFGLEPPTFKGSVAWKWKVQNMSPCSLTKANEDPNKQTKENINTVKENTVRERLLILTGLRCCNEMQPWKGRFKCLWTPGHQPARHYSSILFLSAPERSNHRAISSMFFKAQTNSFRNNNITTSSFQNVRQKSSKGLLLSNGRIFLSCHLAPFDSGWSIQWTLRRCGDVQELEVGS